MSDIVERLRGGTCPKCYWFGEVSYGDGLVRYSCPDKHEAPISMEHRKEAASVIEALRGEVERLKVHRDAVAQTCALGFSEFERVKAERDRLKAALEEIAIKAGTSVFAGAVAAGRLLDDIEHMADKALAGETT